MATLLNWHNGRSRGTTRGLTVMVAALGCSTCFAQDCRFLTTGSTLNFPALDPLAASTATAMATVQVRCTPASVSPTWSFSGANGSAPLRMKHATTADFIPYTVVPTFQGRSGSTETWRLTGTVLGANYQNARTGAYNDILTASILP